MVLSYRPIVWHWKKRIANLVELRNGLGKHIFIYSPNDGIEKARALLKGIWAFQIISLISNNISKLAV